MTYHSQALLQADPVFNSRVYSVCVEQADTFKDDQRAAYVAVAESIIRDDQGLWAVFNRLDAAGPGIADKVDNGDGTIDQAKVTDADLLSLTQGNWPVVADLYFDAEGQPKP